MSEVRLAIRFSRGAAAREMTHLESIAAWDTALRSSGLALAQTEGARPRSRFALAAPLPPGYTSEAEWLEAGLGEEVELQKLVSALNSCLPDGVRALEARVLEPNEPSLQARLRFAEYRMPLSAAAGASRLDAAIEGFFGRASMPWSAQIDGKTKRFDLRGLVDDLWVEQSEGGMALGMRLDASTTGTGRPDSVLAGLGLEPTSRHRTRLLFSHIPEALRLWRRKGRFETDRVER